MATGVTPGRPCGVRRPRRGVGPAGGLAAASLFLMPSLVGFFIFTAFPVVAAIGLAFYDYDLLLGGSSTAWTTSASARQGRRLPRGGGQHLLLHAVSVPLSVVLGLGAALLVNEALRGIVFFRTIYLLPYVTVTVAVALVWRWIYLPDVGLMNTFLGWFGITGPTG